MGRPAVAGPTMNAVPRSRPMRLSRVRFSVRGVMAAVMAVAVALAVMGRRHPVGGMAVAGLGVVMWSDGSMTKGAMPVPTDYQGLGPLLKVGWSDGSTSWYLGR